MFFVPFGLGKEGSQVQRGPMAPLPPSFRGAWAASAPETTTAARAGTSVAKAVMIVIFMGLWGQCRGMCVWGRVAACLFCFASLHRLFLLQPITSSETGHDEQTELRSLPVPVQRPTQTQHPTTVLSPQSTPSAIAVNLALPSFPTSPRDIGKTALTTDYVCRGR